MMPGSTLGGVFISYSSDDRAIVSVAARLLRAAGANVFQDIADIEFGAHWETALLKAIAQCERVMVFWSAAAAQSSWVEREWRCALAAGKRIVPMLLDKTPLPAPLAVLHGVPDLLDMLRAAMRLAAASDPLAAIVPTVVPKVAATPAAPPAQRAPGKLGAVAAGLAGGTVLASAAALGWWYGRRASPDDYHRDLPDPGAAGPVGPIDSLMLPAGWWLIGGLLLLIGLALWLARRRSQRRDIAAQPEAEGLSHRQPDDVDPAQPLAWPVAAEWARLSARFTSALFDN